MTDSDSSAINFVDHVQRSLDVCCDKYDMEFSVVCGVNTEGFIAVNLHTRIPINTAEFREKLVALVATTLGAEPGDWVSLNNPSAKA
jgi:hypothetical protein